MDAETWARLNRLLDEALDLPVTERSPWLDALPQDDAELRPRLARLLAHATADDGFLDRLPELEAIAGGDEPGAHVESAGTVGPYRLLRELGEGGMGTVWLAERTDGLIKRPVALKLPRDLSARGRIAERLARERDILASLNHPHIARLYDAGQTPSGQPYLAMEYVEGQRLDEHAASSRLDLRARLHLFLQIARAVAHAHANLVIHRDLKPSNILVTPEGEVRLLDFGIAKLLEGDTAHGTALTELAGRPLTPGYASPEQIRGEPLTVATDVYSLGVVLYELLTGASPYKPRHDSRGGLENAVIETDPARPSDTVSDPQKRRSLRGDLDVIVLKALKKRPEERYATVNALAEDIERYLAGQPVTAQPDSAVYRLSKVVRRHRASVAAAASVLLAVFIGAGIALWQARVALDEKERAEEVQEFIASIFQGVNPELAGAARPLTAIEILDQAQRRVTSELGGQPDLQLRLRSVIGRSYLGLFEPARASEVLASALAGAARMPEADREIVRSIHLLMAQALVPLRRADEAERHVALALPPADARSPDATFVAAKVTASAIEYHRGQYDQAAAVAGEALAAANRIPALDPTVLMEVHTAIGKAAGMQREREQSLNANRRAFELARQIFSHDRDHPRVLESEHDYAASLIDVGQLDEATPHLRRSLQGAQAAFGKESLLAGRYAVRLGLVLMERGELADAIELIAWGNRIEASFETGRSPATAGRQRTLGRAYMAAWRMRDAAPQLDAAIATMAGFDAPFMMHVLKADRAFVTAATSGNFAESVAELEGVIEAQDRGDTRYKTHLPDIYLGVLHLWAGDSLRALQHLDRGVELARVQTRVSDLGEALTFLGLARLEQGDAIGAEQALQEGLDLLRTAQAVVTPAQAHAWLGLGRVELTRGQHDAALRHLRAAAEFWISFAPDNRGAGDAAFWLGRALAALNRSVEATREFERAARLLAASPIPSDRALARIADRDNGSR
jgi:eukaryotic-like serine/threonine-protein kinase